MKECVGEAILKQLPVVGARQVGKSPALPNKPSSLEWETAMTLNTKLSVKKWAILPLFVTRQRGDFQKEMGARFVDPIYLFHQILLFIWYIVL